MWLHVRHLSQGMHLPVARVSLPFFQPLEGRLLVLLSSAAPELCEL